MIHAVEDHRQTETSNNDVVANIREQVRNNRKLTTCKLANETILVGSCHTILTANLQMRKDAIKFILRFLSLDQKKIV